MAAVVPEFPPEIDVLDDDGDGVATDDFFANDVRIASPVRATAQWEAWNGAAVWALGHGGTLIMQGPVALEIAPGETVTWRHVVQQHDQCRARLWCLTLSCASAPTVDDWSSFGIIELPSGVSHQWRIAPSDYLKGTPFEFVESVAPTGFDNGQLLLNISVNAAAVSGVAVMAFACYELPRLDLDTFGPSEYPVCEPHTLQTNAPIVEGGTDTNKSVGGLYRIATDPDQLMREVRRPCLWSDFRPAGISTIGTSYTNLFFYDVSVLAIPRYLGENQRTVRVYVYGRGPAGSNVRFTAASGDTVVVNLGTSNGLVEGVLDIDTEDAGDYAATGGLRDGARDTIAIEAQRVGGSAGDCVVYGTWIEMAGGL